MAEGQASSETWGEYNRLWQTYQDFQPKDDNQRVWYTESLQTLNALGDARRDRLLNVRSHVPTIMWVVLLGGGAITIGFSFLFGMRNARAQAFMTAGLALIIGLVLLSIVALEKPFAGITRVGPKAFEQLNQILELLRKPL